MLEASLTKPLKNQMMEVLIFGKKAAIAIADYQKFYPKLYRVVAEKISEKWQENVFF